MYTFSFGEVVIMVRYCVERYEQIDAGARIDLRRIEPYEGNQHRPGAEGFRLLPVGDGGIWRADLSYRVDCEVPEKRYHYHPDFRDGDVGPRACEEDLTADPLGWLARRLLDLPQLLEERGYSDLAKSVDPNELARTMPMIMKAVEVSLQP
jgi:hypothetical protein